MKTHVLISMVCFLRINTSRNDLAGFPAQQIALACKKKLEKGKGLCKFGLLGGKNPLFARTSFSHPPFILASCEVVRKAFSSSATQNRNPSIFHDPPISKCTQTHVYSPLLIWTSVYSRTSIFLISKLLQCKISICRIRNKKFEDLYAQKCLRTKIKIFIVTFLKILLKEQKIA